MSPSTHLVGGQRRGEVVAVQVASRVDMSEANCLPTLHRGPAVTRGAPRPTDTPVAVTVLHHRDAGHRLLPTACLTHTEGQIQEIKRTNTYTATKKVN